jgi:proteasome lid subunit RPN8/RPN11
LDCASWTTWGFPYLTFSPHDLRPEKFPICSRGIVKEYWALLLRRAWIEMAKSKIKSSACVIDSEVIRQIRQHARSHMKTEVCGVLIGDIREGAICVDHYIAGVNAAQAGSHVTFTQDTWEHVYKIKDKEFPEARIVGWYHSHPGFGVFLSEHDTFIHRNFFSSHDQIAWVYDPHSDEEGCFGWVDDRIERVSSIKMSDRRGGEPADSTRKHETILVNSEEEEVDGPIGDRADDLDSIPWGRWTTTILTHVLALVIGFLVSWFLFPRPVFVAVPVDPQTGRPLTESTPTKPSANGIFGAQPSIQNDEDKNNLRPSPPPTAPDSVKGNNAPTR